jgi:hypothetical protein
MCCLIRERPVVAIGSRARREAMEPAPTLRERVAGAGRRR